MNNPIKHNVFLISKEGLKFMQEINDLPIKEQPQLKTQQRKPIRQSIQNQLINQLKQEQPELQNFQSNKYFNSLIQKQTNKIDFNECHLQDQNVLQSLSKNAHIKIITSRICKLVRRYQSQHQSLQKIEKNIEDKINQKSRELSQSNNYEQNIINQQIHQLIGNESYKYDAKKILKTKPYQNKSFAKHEEDKLLFGTFNYLETQQKKNKIDKIFLKVFEQNEGRKESNNIFNNGCTDRSQTDIFYK